MNTFITFSPTNGSAVPLHKYIPLLLSILVLYIQIFPSRKVKIPLKDKDDMMSFTDAKTRLAFLIRNWSPALMINMTSG